MNRSIIAKIPAQPLQQQTFAESEQIIFLLLGIGFLLTLLVAGFFFYMLSRKDR